MAGSPLMLAPDEWSGRKLGKYEIVCRLSMGGMSEIFLAFQRGLAGFRKFVVLKQILPDIKGEEEFVRMFLDEAKITAAFNHPNIAQVYDLDIAEGELFLAMEFVPGATLVEVARACRQNNEPIPIGFTLMAVRDTALALHYAHTFTDPTGRVQQVIHRDIAEKNIMVTYDGATKLLDFGIAKALNRVSRTTVGMVKGTSGYMSPEQILGEKLDPRSDLFSLGVVLHECLTGMRLFHGKTPEEGMMQALKGEVAPPSRQNAAVSPELDAVTLKSLQRKREDRYATTLEFARAIERAGGGNIWHPEQSAEFVQRLFSQRREQTRGLMSQSHSPDLTGEFKLSEFFATEGVKPPQAPPPLPQVSAAPPSPPPPPIEAATVIVPPESAGPRRAPPPPPPSLEPKKAVPPRASGPKQSPPLQSPPRRKTVLPPPVPDAPDFEDLEPGERTIPATRVPARYAAPSKAKTSRHAEDETSPGVRMPEFDREEASVTLSGRTHPSDTNPTPTPRGTPAWAVAVLGLALLAGLGTTTWALGLHQPLMEAVGLKLGQTPAPVVVSQAAEPIALPAPPAAAPPEAPTPEPVAAVAPAKEKEPEPKPDLAVAALETPVPTTKPDAGVVKPPRKVKVKAVVKPEPAVEEAPATTEETASAEPTPDDAWEAAAKDRAAANAMGTLTLVTEPWSTVFLGGKELGITPLVKVELAAGKHTLKLVGPDKKALGLTVEISEGNETKVRVPLSTLGPL